MARIVISENVSVEGFGGGERLMDRVGRIQGEAAKILLCEALDAQAVLLGRRTYESFAARWPARSGELADRLNSMPKYAVSSTLHDAAWTNTSVLAGDVVAEVSKLKQELSGDIVIYGSIQLVRTLMEHDLADELRLMIYPVAVGAGERLFGETADMKPLRLAAVQAVDDGVVYLRYERVRDA